MKATEQGPSHQTAAAGRTSPFVARSLAALALVLGLGACVQETSSVSINPPKGASAEQAVREFTVMIAVAETIDLYCRPYGVRKTFGDFRQTTFDYARKLMEQGFSEAELERAIAPPAREAALNEAIRRLEAGGVRQNDVGSLCRYGKNEIAKGTPTGQLLRLTQ